MAIYRKKDGVAGCVWQLPDYDYLIFELEQPKNFNQEKAVELLFPELDWIAATSVPFAIGLNLLQGRFVSCKTKTGQLLFPLKSILSVNNFT